MLSASACANGFSKNEYIALRRTGLKLWLANEKRKKRKKRRQLSFYAGFIILARTLFKIAGPSVSGETDDLTCCPL